MKKVLRKTLREILKQLCIIAIKKHSLEIICVGGWYGTDITREAVYTILKKSGMTVRRNIHSPQIDFDIPLTILGIRSTPTYIASWLYQIMLSIIRLIFLRPVASILVLQVNTQDAGIMKYWMSFLESYIVIMLNSHVGTLNLELLLVERLKQVGGLILSNDNIRTKSLGQGKKGVIFFGEQKLNKKPPDFSFSMERVANNVYLTIHHGMEHQVIDKTFPEFILPFLTAATAITTIYPISLQEACSALCSFELPSDKIEKIFHRFLVE